MSLKGVEDGLPTIPRARQRFERVLRWNKTKIAVCYMSLNGDRLNIILAISVLVSIDDLYVFIISILGILLGLFYMATESSEEASPKFDEFRRQVQISIRFRGDTDVVLQDYESSIKEVDRRENIGLLIGSILITGSLIILGNTATSENPKFPYALTSILIFVVWLFVLHHTTKWLDSMAYSRIRALEEAISSHAGYDFGIHSYMYGRTHPRNRALRRLRVRRLFWGFVLVSLSIAWLLLSISVTISF